MQQANGTTVGIGIVVEKVFNLRERLEQAGLTVSSLCKVASLSGNKVTRWRRSMKTFILSLQHLLAMYAERYSPIIVGTSLDFTPEQIAFLVTVDIFMCGVATFLQVWKGTGIGLPIVLGCTFTAVAPMILIGQTKGIGDLYGSLFCRVF